MIIRILLIAAALLLAVLALRTTPTTRGLALRRLGLICFTASWIVAVISPDLLSHLATFVGVTRGTDLLLYTLVVAVALILIGVYKRFVVLESRLAQLTRELAILTAQRADVQPGSAEYPPASSSSPDRTSAFP
ncbi:DUF2304 domain-containing protein [Nocardioides sp.]|uniref:DUF2304 domain-containing protein n=1 Tax=Nocardioides sp. TaxID=35761 RepID=UPI00262AD94C|nr:DUF2304 domain-containing protein [Nocardioides sp.]